MLTLPKPRLAEEPVPAARPADIGHPHTPEPVTEPDPGTPVRARPTRTRRPGQWLSGLVRGITASAF